MKNGAFVKNLGSPLKVLDIGHGQSVLSPAQYKILLGFRSFPQGRRRDLPGQGPAATGDHRGHRSDPARFARGRCLAACSPRASRLRRSFARRDPPGAAGRPGTHPIHRDRSRGDPGAGLRPSTKRAPRRRSRASSGSNPSSIQDFYRHDMLPLARAYKERAAFTSRHLLAALARRAGCSPVHLFRHRDRQTVNCCWLVLGPNSTRGSDSGTRCQSTLRAS